MMKWVSLFSSKRDDCDFLPAEPALAGVDQSCIQLPVASGGLPRPAGPIRPPPGTRAGFGKAFGSGRRNGHSGAASVLWWKSRKWRGVHGLLICLAVLALLDSTSAAFAYTVKRWTRSLGLPYFWTEVTSACTLTDGKIVICGWTSYDSDFFDGDAWCVKLDLRGNVIWQRSYGGKGFDWANSLTATSDGGFIVVGTSDSWSSWDWDIWCAKLESDGNIEWQRTYDQGLDETGWNARQTRDGGFLLLGDIYRVDESRYDLTCLKLHGDGRIEWQRNYARSGSELAWQLLILQDGGCLIVGGIAPDNNDHEWGSRGWCLRLDANGKIVWQRAYGEGYYNEFFDGVTTSDGAAILAGHSRAENPIKPNQDDAWCLKIAQDGDIVWQYRYGGDRDDDFRAIAKVGGGRFLVGGATDSYRWGQGTTSAWAMLLTSDGTTVWQEAYDSAIMSRATETMPFFGNRQLLITESPGSRYGTLLQVPALGRKCGSARVSTSVAMPANAKSYTTTATSEPGRLKTKVVHAGPRNGFLQIHTPCQ